MIYLHIAQCDLIKAHSPLDTLYGFQKNEDRDGDKDKGKKQKK
jgi:hypothetical protein